MNENLDLCEILKGCEGMDLWSSVVGPCALRSIDPSAEYPIKVRDHTGDASDYAAFTREGLFLTDYDKGECVLFPSKDQRDWSKFVRPIKEGTPMMCSDGFGGPKFMWRLRYYSGVLCRGRHFVTDFDFSLDSKVDRAYKYMIPFDQFDPNDIEGSIRDHNIQTNI